MGNSKGIEGKDERAGEGRGMTILRGKRDRRIRREQRGGPEKPRRGGGWRKRGRIYNYIWGGTKQTILSLLSFSEVYT